MKLRKTWGYALSGIAAGAVTGLFGAGGGMLLVPMMHTFTDIRDDELFPSSVCIILPICIVSLIMMQIGSVMPWKEAIPYLIGSTIGGIIAGLWGQKIPTLWLHRILGIMILWGGIRYLC